MTIRELLRVLVRFDDLDKDTSIAHVNGEGHVQLVEVASVVNNNGHAQINTGDMQALLDALRTTA